MKKKVIIICITALVVLLLTKESSHDKMKTQVIQDFLKYRDSFEIICKDINASNLEEINKNNYVGHSSSDQDKKAYECIFEKSHFTSIIKNNDNIVFKHTKGKYGVELIYSKNPEDYMKYYQVLDENWYYNIFMYE